MKEQIEKQAIEEMAATVSNAIFEWANEYAEEDFCPVYVAKAIYNTGYRKQSEWISVDERLPQVTGKYICVVKDKGGEWVYGEYDTPHCSECGHEPKEISPFCSACGASIEED